MMATTRNDCEIADEKSISKDSEIETAIRKYNEAIDFLSTVDRDKVLRLILDSNLKAEELFKKEHPFDLNDYRDLPNKGE